MLLHLLALNVGTHRVHILYRFCPVFMGVVLVFNLNSLHSSLQEVLPVFSGCLDSVHYYGPIVHVGIGAGLLLWSYAQRQGHPLGLGRS